MTMTMMLDVDGVINVFDRITGKVNILIITLILIAMFPI